MGWRRTVRLYTKLTQAERGERSMTVAEWDRLSRQYHRRVDRVREEGKRNGYIHDFRDDQ